MRATITWTLVFAMALMPSVVAASEAATPRLQNVELNKHGQVQAMIVKPDGSPMAKTRVLVRTKSEQAEVVTNERGQFTLTSASAGNCAVVVGDKAYACRLWKQGTAPPRSLKSFGVVHGSEVVRGQDCAEGCDVRGTDGSSRFGRIGNISGSQLLGLGLLAGAVVAIVLAANNDDDAS